MNVMSITKIRKGLAVIALMGALIGGLAACGSSPGTAQAPKSPTSTTAQAPAIVDPAKDMAAWAAAGGTDDLKSIDRCMSAMGNNPTQEQIGALNNAVAKAQSRPMPASVDPRGAYASMLGHLKKVVAAYANGDMAIAMSESGSIAADMNMLQDEIKAAGFDVSS
jgi:hypothetical protein